MENEVTPESTPEPVAEPTVEPTTVSWQDSIPEDIRFKVDGDNKIDRFEKFKTPADLAKSYHETQKMVGDSIRLPSDDNPDSWNKIYDKLGRPETPDKYELNYDGPVEMDNDLIDGFKKFAHEHGYNQKQFDDTVKFQLSAVEQAQKMYENAAAEGIAELKKEWGSDFEVNSTLAEKTINKLGLNEILDSGNPLVKKAFAQLGSKLSEGTLKEGDGDGKSDPKEELKEIIGSDAFKNKMHPDHKQAHARFLELHGVK